MLRRDFILGEKKYIKFKATSYDGVPVIIIHAAYELLKDNVVVSSGACEINGESFMALIEPLNLGEHVLEVTYTVAPETRKVRVAINVT